MFDTHPIRDRKVAPTIFLLLVYPEDGISNYWVLALIFLLGEDFIILERILKNGTCGRIEKAFDGVSGQGIRCENLAAGPGDCFRDGFQKQPGA